MANSFFLYFKARKDVEAILDHLFLMDDNDLMVKFYDDLSNKLERLYLFPDHCPKFFSQLLEGQVLRSCVFGGYTLVYFLNEELDRIDVVRIFHNKSNKKMICE